ncbi:alpha/beta fold hydrolase [Jiella sp. M17.18]|uniref:alpha/beta fold hydrolase n=1 Tax=Jiella sp. M17.18 TaxID=3234247 RepID=UPI0034E02EC9
MRKRDILWKAGATLAVGIGATAVSAERARRHHPPTGRFLDVDGVSLHFVERGSGPPVVLLHGNGSMIADFVSSGLVDKLAASRRVIVFDRPGYGHSSRPRGRAFTPVAQADLFAEAVRRLGAEPAHVLGHSWGALVAAEWGLRHPETVSGLTLVAGFFFPVPRADVLFASAPAAPVLGSLARRTVLPPLGRLTWGALLGRIFGPNPVPEHWREGFPREMALTPRALRASAEETAAMIPAARRAQDRYGTLRPPLTIVAGKADRMVATSQQSERLHEAVAGSRLVLLPGVGHMVHHVDPDAVAEAVDAARPRDATGAAAPRLRIVGAP